MKPRQEVIRAFHDRNFGEILALNYERLYPDKGAASDCLGCSGKYDCECQRCQNCEPDDCDELCKPAEWNSEGDRIGNSAAALAWPALMFWTLLVLAVGILIGSEASR